MFNFIKRLERIKRVVVTSPTQTTCTDCGAYIDKINEVLTESGSKFYFCGKCKKPYSRTEGGFFTRGVYKYFAEVEVTEEGIPVGYVKAKKK